MPEDITKVYDKLVELANGDPDRAEEAVRDAIDQTFALAKAKEQEYRDALGNPIGNPANTNDHDLALIAALSTLEKAGAFDTVFPPE